jgi:hypothetical protein
MFKLLYIILRDYFRIISEIVIICAQSACVIFLISQGQVYFYESSLRSYIFVAFF